MAQAVRMAAGWYDDDDDDDDCDGDGDGDGGDDDDGYDGADDVGDG